MKTKTDWKELIFEPHSRMSWNLIVFAVFKKCHICQDWVISLKNSGNFVVSIANATQTRPKASQNNKDSCDSKPEGTRNVLEICVCV